MDGKACTRPSRSTATLRFTLDNAERTVIDVHDWAQRYGARVDFWRLLMRAHCVHDVTDSDAHVLSCRFMASMLVSA
jgi:hypothetical protein